MPFAGDQPWSAFTCHPLTGGSHNTLYRLTAPGRDVVLRLERFGKSSWASFIEEVRNARVAHGLGIGPGILASDASDGTLLMTFVEGPGMTSARFQNEPVWVDRAAELYRTLHRGPAFSSRFDIFPQIASLRSRLEATLPEGFTGLIDTGREIDPLLEALQASRPTPVPCHNDPAAQNFIASGNGTKLVLVDWQCSGQADPHWELGSFLAETALSEELTDRFLIRRFGTSEGYAPGRVRLYQVVSDYYWTLRSLEDAGKRTTDEEGWRRIAQSKWDRLLRRLSNPSCASLRDRLRRWSVTGAW
jgi:thiamine kinase-like enzyme